VQINAGGTTSPESTPIVMYNALGAGVRNVRIIFDATHSQANSLIAQGVMAAINEGTVADYYTLFDNTTFDLPSATPYSGTDVGVRKAGMIENVINFSHSDADGDIDDIGLAFTTDSPSGGSEQVFAIVAWW